MLTACLAAIMQTARTVEQHSISLPAGGQRADHRSTSTAVLSIIRRDYPYWDRRQGADHIWLFSHDHGFCGFESNGGGVPELANSIILSHCELPLPVTIYMSSY